MTTRGVNKTTEESIEEEEVEGRGYLCGVPAKMFQAFVDGLVGTKRKAFLNIYRKLKAFQDEIDAFSDDDGLTAEFVAIDAEEKDKTVAYRRKLKLAVTRVDPRLMERAITAGLRDGDMYAAKQLSEIMALPVEAKIKAADDRPPGIVFEYQEMSEEDDDENP